MRILITIFSVTCISFSFSNSSLAFDVCALKNVSIPNSENFSAVQISSYQQRMNRECELSKSFQDLKSKAKGCFGLELSQIYEYQALRYILRADYDKAKAQDIPLNIIYQRYQKDYSLPNDQKSSEIWDNFQDGISQLATTVPALVRGQSFVLKDFLKIHAGFYQVSDETGDFAGFPHPGVLKPSTWKDGAWSEFSSDQLDVFKTTVQLINDRYQSFGLLSSFDESAHPYVNQVLSVRPTENGNFGLFHGDANSVEDHMHRILTFMNEAIAQASQGQPMVMKGQLLSPAQLAYFVQQYVVQTHPFTDGNGRTSRFLQELILASFSLPSGASGDLMAIDAIDYNDVYYKIAMDQNFLEFKDIRDCLDRVYPKFLANGEKLAEVDPEKIEYQCRLVR